MLVGKTALLVEDDEAIRTFLRRYLMRMGLAVLEADNGLSGIRQFGSGEVSIVVTDIFMPVMDGIKMISELKRLDRKLPVIAVTGGDESVGMKAKSVGASVILYKPVFRVALTDAVNKVLSGV